MADLPDGKTLVYDAGSLTSAGGASDALAAHLWGRGRTHIDTLIISHADADHYNAIPAILERFTVGLIATPAGMLDRDDDPLLSALIVEIGRRQIPIVELRRGDSLGDRPALGSNDDFAYVIDVLHPPAGFLSTVDNARSITLRLNWQGRSVLLPGDLEGDGLSTFLSTPIRPADVVMAPHHGSRASSPPEFVAAVAPSVVIFSGREASEAATARREYGLPDDQTFHTAADGAITVRLRKDRIRVESFWSRRQCEILTAPLIP